MSDQRGHSGKDPKTGPGTQAETPGEGEPGWEPVTPGDATNEAAGRPDGDAAKTRLDDVIQEAARAGARGVVVALDEFGVRHGRPILRPFPPPYRR